MQVWNCAHPRDRLATHHTPGSSSICKPVKSFKHSLSVKVLQSKFQKQESVRRLSGFSNTDNTTTLKRTNLLETSLASVPPNLIQFIRTWNENSSRWPSSSVHWLHCSAVLHTWIMKCGHGMNVESCSILFLHPHQTTVDICKASGLGHKWSLCSDSPWWNEPGSVKPAWSLHGLLRFFLYFFQNARPALPSPCWSSYDLAYIHLDLIFSVFMISNSILNPVPATVKN